MKRCLLLSVIILIAGSLFALDNKYNDYLSFSITPQFDITTGVIKEFVFDPECTNTDNIESQLDWNLKALAIFRVQAEFNIIKYISLGLSGSFTVPQRSDYMQDYDWLNYIYWQNDDPTELTNFSEHINTLDKFTDFNVSLGGCLYLPAEIKIKPYIAYQYEFIRFTGSNGYSKYKSNSFEIQSFSGNVISYEQELNSFLLGLGVQADFIPQLCLKLNFNISPQMSSLSALDYHYARGLVFNDRIKKLTLINSELSAQYHFSKNHSAGFSGKIQYIPLARGDTYQSTINSSGELTSDNWINIGTDSGGTDRFIWSLGINYSFSL